MSIAYLIGAIICVSCGNNRISINAESAIIDSPDGFILKNLILENDSAEFIYRIVLKKGCKGLTSIDLNHIDSAYMILYNDDYVANEEFHLQPNLGYSISNLSEPDAGVQTISFYTDSCSHIISTEED